MIERLLNLLEEDLKVSLGDVARESGVLYDTLNQIRAGRVKTMRCDTLAAVVKAYPTINANYVLTGEGKPLLTSVHLADEVPTIYITRQGNVNVEIRE